MRTSGRPDWPPTHRGEVDGSRLHWLEHPELHTTEVMVAPDVAVLVGGPISRSL